MNDFIQRAILLDKQEGIIRQIPISDCDSEYSRLISFLKEKGYQISYSLKENNGRNAVAIIIDNVDNDVFESGVTGMACWCNGKRRPLNVEQFISNYNDFIINKDIDKYHMMTVENNEKFKK